MSEPARVGIFPWRLDRALRSIVSPWQTPNPTANISPMAATTNTGRCLRP